MQGRNLFEPHAHQDKIKEVANCETNLPKSAAGAEAGGSGTFDITEATRPIGLRTVS